MTMDVDTAKAQLALAETRVKYLEAKAAYFEDMSDEKAKAVYRKLADEYVAVRDNWKLNFRTAPNGPGDGTVAPEPLKAKGGK